MKERGSGNTVAVIGAGGREHVPRCNRKTPSGCMYELKYEKI